MIGNIRNLSINDIWYFDFRFLGIENIRMIIESAGRSKLDY